jgi:myo-inositol catabolism protein IolC
VLFNTCTFQQGLLDRAIFYLVVFYQSYMAPKQSGGMAVGRGLLTDGEREYLRGEATDQRMYEARSRFRSRIEHEVAEDIEILKENQPELLEELREVVCDES